MTKWNIWIYLHPPLDCCLPQGVINPWVELGLLLVDGDREVVHHSHIDELLGSTDGTKDTSDVRVAVRGTQPLGGGAEKCGNY